MELIKQVNRGYMFMDECELCNKHTQIFQPAGSCRKSCLICIITRSGFDNDFPCMNCVYYGFTNYNGKNYPGDGFGKCCQCTASTQSFGLPAPPAYRYVYDHINNTPDKRTDHLEEVARQADNGLLFYGQCELCNLKSQIFQPKDSDRNICLYCIIKQAASDDDYMPCLNCIYYGFNNPDHHTYPGNGFGKCYNCDAFQNPKIQEYHDEIPIDMYKSILDKITKLPSLNSTCN